MKFVFRVDASLSIGTGHVSRCLTLAGLLKEKKSESFFLYRNITQPLVKDIIRAGHRACWLNYGNQKAFGGADDHQEVQELTDWQEDAKAVLATLKGEGEIDWLVVDHYGLDKRWQQLVRKAVNGILVIDDLANRPHDCDLLLDQNLHRNSESLYKELVPRNCRMFLGPQHALLRLEFVKARTNMRERDGHVRRIIVFFGGSDPTNETAKALEAITVNGLDLEVDVVLGASNPHQDHLENKYGGNPSFRFYRTVGNMAQMMTQADLAIGAGGGTTWERCFLGVPAIVIVVAENQMEIAKSTAQAGAVINLGWWENVDTNRLVQGIQSAIADPNRLKKMSIKAMALMDGRAPYGEEELIKVMLEGSK